MIKCEICNEEKEVLIVRTDLYGYDRYIMCPNCEVGFINYNLTQKQYFNLLKNGHSNEEFMLHEDFYDVDTGEAVQPRI